MGRCAGPDPSESELEGRFTAVTVSASPFMAVACRLVAATCRFAAAVVATRQAGGARGRA